MKRPLTIFTAAVLIAVLLYACASTIRTATTSFVTITIGSAPNTALLKAEAATHWVRFKHYLADAKWMPEAYAYIPSIVQVVVVTVTAPDMTTPIVGVSSIKDTDVAASIRIEVPNGSARQFTVEGIRGVNSTTYYRGAATSDLNGTDINLPVSMSFVGTGIYVDPTLDPAVADVSTCGTQASPCATIKYVLNTRPSTTNNDVVLALAGTYKVGSVAAQEIFPLQLKPGMALLCMGVNFSSIITVAGSTAILGNDGAAVDNCMIKATPGTGTISGIDDQGTRTKINGVSIELSGSPSVDVLIGASMSNDSSLLESTITGSSASLSVYGVKVTGGKPSIIGNKISTLPIGVELTAGAGDADITGNIFDSNTTTGLSLAGAGKVLVSANTFTQQFPVSGTGIDVISGNPDITGNTILGHNIGIRVSDASPAITGNRISNNWIGIDIATAAGVPRVNGNTIYCNQDYDVGVNDPSGALVFDLRNNSWDHDVTTSPTGTPPGPTIFTGTFSNNQGDDIQVTTPTPTPQYIPFSAAVPNGCLPPLGVGKPAN